MAKLTSSKRKSLATTTFGLPSQRKYPMPDASHAANAKARASQQYNAGNLSASQKAQIDEKANVKLHSGNHAPGCGTVGHGGPCPT